MTTVRQFLIQTKDQRIHRGLPSSRKLHAVAVRRAHIVAMRDWIEAREEKAAEKHKETPGALQTAMFKIRAFGAKFRPWLRGEKA